MTISEIPMHIWLVVFGYVTTAAGMIIRHEVKISNMKEENKTQDKTITEIYDKVSATREDVAEIKGMLSSRSRDRG